MFVTDVNVEMGLPWMGSCFMVLKLVLTYRAGELLERKGNGGGILCGDTNPLDPRLPLLVLVLDTEPCLLWCRG